MNIHTFDNHYVTCPICQRNAPLIIIMLLAQFAKEMRDQNQSRPALAYLAVRIVKNDS